MKRMGAKIFVNSITMIRVIGTFWLPIICIKLNYKDLIVYLILLLLTDSIDGFFARKLNVSTIFGAMLDACADKLLGIATFAVLARRHPVMLLPILTETLIVLINTKGATNGSILESSMLGKVKTWFMGICIILGFCTIYSSELVPLFKIDIIINALSYLKSYESIVMNSLAFISVGADLMVAYDYYNRVRHDINKFKDDGNNIKEIKICRGQELIDRLFDTDYYYKTLNMPLIKRLGVEVKNEKTYKGK